MEGSRRGERGPKPEKGPARGERRHEAGDGGPQAQGESFGVGGGFRSDRGHPGQPELGGDGDTAAQRRGVDGGTGGGAGHGYFASNVRAGGVLRPQDSSGIHQGLCRINATRLCSRFLLFHVFGMLRPTRGRVVVHVQSLAPRSLLVPGFSTT